MKKIIRTYSDLSTLKTFVERFEYLKLNGTVGQSTFGYDRYLNQLLYNSTEWKSLKTKIVIRDNGCDLGVEGYEIHDKIIIHHMNPITVDDILKRRDIVFDPEFLISTIHNTHMAIHYSDENLLIKAPIERFKNDTCPWRR